MSLGYGPSPMNNPFPGHGSGYTQNHGRGAPQRGMRIDEDWEFPMRVSVRVHGSWMSGLIIGTVAGVLNRTGMDCRYNVEIDGPDGRAERRTVKKKDIRSLFD